MAVLSPRMVVGGCGGNLLNGLIFLAASLAYTDRVNISVAALAMQQEFGWYQTQKGFILSSFFIGYMLCLLLSGWLATRFGGKLRQQTWWPPT